MNPLLELARHDQSIWVDTMRRQFVDSGALAKLINEDGLTGVTSNPAIFEKAIAESDDYTAIIAANPQLETLMLYEQLALEDIRRAADVLLPVYKASSGRDGYASLEVSPRLAHDTQATVAEARRLWAELARPNVMIKVPGTAHGIAAIEILIADGINLNVTLLFSTAVYEQVVHAYLRGLEKFVATGGDPAYIASVASFFISRIDSVVDALIDRRLADGTLSKEAAALRGQIAIANAKHAYWRYQALFSGTRWSALAAQGARPQRLLWASTGVKDPNYRDVRYVEELIGANTVNTVPPATLNAFRDHGIARPSLTENVDQAVAMLALATHFGLPLEDITARLLEDGLRLFNAAFDRMLDAVYQAQQLKEKRQWN
ncbi:MAG: transaldolase [Sulfuriferula sp.]